MDGSARDRLKALELLGKHWGLFVERHEVGGPGDFVKLTDAEIDAEIMALGAHRLGMSDAEIAAVIMAQAAKPLVN